MKDDDSTLVSAKRKYAMSVELVIIILSNCINKLKSFYVFRLYWMNKFVRIILFLSLLRGMYRTGKMMHSRLSLRGSSVTS